MSRNLFSRKNFLSSFRSVLASNYFNEEELAELTNWIVLEEEKVSCEYEVSQMMGPLFDFLEEQVEFEV